MSGARLTPYHWWGPPWAHQDRLTLDDLTTLGTLTSAEAAFLRSHVRSGGSAVVAATPQGAGKSTLAHALADEADSARTRVYLRGNQDSFDWLAGRDPASTTILVNEISDHLPVYCWGGCARRLMDLAPRGFQVIATVHAASPDHLRELLMAPPIAAVPAQVVALDVVVFLDITPHSTRARRIVTSIARWDLDSAGLPVANILEFAS